MIDSVYINNNNEYDTQYGVSIASVNVNGFATSKDKRMELNLWIHKYNIDVICVQEWYKLRDKDKYDLDETDFVGYNIHYTNLKTLIIYKNNLVIDLLNLNLNQEGIDATWIVMMNGKNTIAIGSVYHSPSFECDISELNDNINEIRKEYKNKNIFININGDLNGRHEMWAKRTDKRGENIVEWIGKNDLIIKNEKGINTFRNLKTKKMDAIDISIVTNNMNNIINKWYVNDELNDECGFSDHFCIIMEIEFNVRIEQVVDKYTWRFDVNKNHIYRKIVRKYMNKWDYFYQRYRNNRIMAHKLTHLLQLFIFKAAKLSFGIKKYNRNSFIKLQKEKKN